MADAPVEATAALARFAIELSPASIPDHVRREGVRSLVNIVGCALSGARHDAEDTANGSIAGHRRTQRAHRRRSPV